METLRSLISAVSTTCTTQTITCDHCSVIKSLLAWPKSALFPGMTHVGRCLVGPTCTDISRSRSRSHCHCCKPCVIVLDLVSMALQHDWAIHAVCTIEPSVLHFIVSTLHEPNNPLPLLITSLRALANALMHQECRRALSYETVSMVC
jgi:hypothetical protein